MTHERLAPSSRRVAWELWLLAAANVALAAMLAHFRATKLFGISLVPASNGALTAQSVMLGIVAALLPHRAIWGLLAAFSLALLQGNATSRGNVIIVGFVGLDEALSTLSVLAALQGFRLATGWRLTKEPCVDRRRGQFRIVELLEWTTTVAVALACFVYLQASLPAPVRNRLLPLDYWLAIVPMPLMGVPVALAILAEKRPRSWHILAVIAWCVLVAVAQFFADLRHTRSVTVQMLLALFPRGGGPYLAMFFVAIAINSLVLRWCNYRWRTQSELPAPNGTKMPTNP